MNLPVVLGIDLGTSSVKVSAIDTEGRPVGSGSSSYVRSGDRFARSPIADQMWWEGVKAASAQALSAKPVAVKAIGLSGQMHGVVAVSAQGRVVYDPVLWNDGRAGSVVDRLSQVASPFRGELLNAFFPGLAASIIYWLSEAEPAVLSETRWMLQPKDWLGYRLTGDISTDASDASGTGLWDFRHASWHRAFCDAIPIDYRLLPPVLPGEQARGYLRASAAQDLGLAPGIPVAVGRADTAASLLGSSSPLTPGSTVLTMGTGGQLCQIVASASTEPPEHVMTLVGPTDHSHYLMAATYSAGMSLDWIRRLWSLNWDQFFQIAFSAPPSAEAPIMSPFTRPRQPSATSAAAQAQWCGLHPGNDRADLFRAAVEGIIYALRLAKTHLGAHPAAVPFTICTLVGGLARYDGVRQLVADILQVPVQSPDIVSSSARGATVSASVAAGWFGTAREAAEHFRRPLSVLQPDLSAKPYHDRRFELFRTLMHTQQEIAQ